jgi:hypothetical protein
MVRGQQAHEVRASSPSVGNLNISQPYGVSTGSYTDSFTIIFTCGQIYLHPYDNITFYSNLFRVSVYSLYPYGSANGWNVCNENSQQLIHHNKTKTYFI